jgi:predicted nucleic acid-binding protein
MQPPKIYLDTSVISHLDQPEKPIAQEYSLRLWDAIIAGEYEVWLSEVVFEEIDKCETEKRERLYDFIMKIKHNDIPRIIVIARKKLLKQLSLRLLFFFA